MAPNRNPLKPILMAAMLAAASSDAAWSGEADSSAAETTARAQPGPDQVSLEGLEATTAPPWNPPRALPRRQLWEQVILFPQRVATLPITGIGMILEKELFTIENTAAVPKVQSLLTRSHTFPVKPLVARLGDRTGFGLGVRVRPPFVGPWISATTAASTRKYNSTRVNAKLRHLNAEWGYDWRPNERFYGLGMDTEPSDTSGYASRSQHVRVELESGWNEPSPIDGLPRSSLQAWIGPRNVVTRRGREDDIRSIEERFPEIVANTLDRRIEHLVYGVHFRNDWRRGEPHWGGGWRVDVDAQRFDRPLKALALKSARPDGAQFSRYEYEIESGFSFMQDPRSIRLGVRVVDTDVTSGDEKFLVEDLARLGGRQGLAGFEPDRFHDLDLGVAKLSYIFPLVRRLEMDLHVEAGGVYPDVWHHMTIPSLQTSWGLGIRPRHHRPIGSVGIEWSKETTRVRFQLGGVE